MVSNISKATGPIVTNFHVESPYAEGRELCSNSPESMTNMVAMPIYGNQSAEGTGGLGIIRGNKVGESE